MRRCAHFLWFSFGLWFLPWLPASAGEPIYVERFRTTIGDFPAAVEPDFDDSSWQEVSFHEIPWSGEILWARTSIELRQEHLPERRPLALYIGALASHEVWWDGELLGRGGEVGDSADEERPGPIEQHYWIPERLTSVGTHTLALRVSAFHRHFDPRNGFWGVVIAEYDALALRGSAHTRLALVSLSGMLLVGFFALMMYAQDRRDISFLFLGLLCITGASLLIAESWRNLYGYTYNWHLLRLYCVTSLAWLLDLFLLLFLTRRFPMPGASWFLAAGLVAASIPVVWSRSWDPKVTLGFFGVFVLATWWCLFAAVRRLPGSLLALLGVATGALILFTNPGDFVDRDLYLSLDFLLLCLLGSHVLQIRADRQLREEAMLKSARLEIELLKRHLQPHFMLNTLTALSEWIEEQPRLATRMIQTLAEELRLLSDISSRRLIRMEDEIRLCTSHLAIMSHRTRREYRMTTDDVDRNASIPPAVIHTLVENAITHNDYRDTEVEFRLEEARTPGFRRYVFTAPLGANTDTVSRREGTGLRYVRARLQESFGSAFELHSAPTDRHWRTEILVPEKA